MKKPENGDNGESSPYDRLLQLYYEKTFEGFDAEFKKEDETDRKPGKESKGENKGDIPGKAEKKTKVKTKKKKRQAKEKKAAPSQGESLKKNIN